MIHLNEHLDCGLFMRASLAEEYSANDLLDFYNDRQNIRPTRAFLPPGILLYNEAIIRLDTALYNRVDEDRCVLLDHGVEVEANFCGMMNLPSRRDSIDDGARLYELELIYRPRDDRVRLVNCRLHGPRKKGRKPLFDWAAYQPV